jgi:hypothetical protein
MAGDDGGQNDAGDGFALLALVLDALLADRDLGLDDGPVPRLGLAVGVDPQQLRQPGADRDEPQGNDGEEEDDKSSMAKSSRDGHCPPS